MSYSRHHQIVLEGRLEKRPSTRGSDETSEDYADRMWDFLITQVKEKFNLPHVRGTRQSKTTSELIEHFLRTWHLFGIDLLILWQIHQQLTTLVASTICDNSWIRYASEKPQDAAKLASYLKTTGMPRVSLLLFAYNTPEHYPKSIEMIQGLEYADRYSLVRKFLTTIKSAEQRPSEERIAEIGYTIVRPLDRYPNPFAITQERDTMQMLGDLGYDDVVYRWYQHHGEVCSLVIRTLVRLRKNEEILTSSFLHERIDVLMMEAINCENLVILEGVLPLKRFNPLLIRNIIKKQSIAVVRCLEESGVSFLNSYVRITARIHIPMFMLVIMTSDIGVEFVETLIMHGANVNRTSAAGYWTYTCILPGGINELARKVTTPLEAAIVADRVDIARLLLTLGAFIDPKINPKIRELFETATPEMKSLLNEAGLQEAIDEEIAAGLARVASQVSETRNITTDLLAFYDISFPRTPLFVEPPRPTPSYRAAETTLYGEPAGAAQAPRRISNPRMITPDMLGSQDISTSYIRHTIEAPPPPSIQASLVPLHGKVATKSIFEEFDID